VTGERGDSLDSSSAFSSESSSTRKRLCSVGLSSSEKVHSQETRRDDERNGGSTDETDLPRHNDGNDNRDNQCGNTGENGGKSSARHRGDIVGFRAKEGGNFSSAVLVTVEVAHFLSQEG